MSPTAHHRLPRAGVDPVTTDGVALATVLAAVHLPLRHETIVLLLDDARRGLAVVVVSDTASADAVVAIAERLFDPRAHGARVGAAIVASVRPADSGVEFDADDLADADRWLELDEIAEQCGVELVEWYVLGRDVSRPRELLGAPPRW